MKILTTRAQELIFEGFKSDYIFETIRSTGNFYEIATLEKWTPLFKNSKVILDIGANLGNHSLYWATALKPDAVYAFEPLPVNFQRLKNNIERNGLKKIITPINKAAGDREGYVAVVELDGTNLGGTRFGYVNGCSPEASEIITIDSFVAERRPMSVDMVKIDTEGFEVPVLLGMRGTINKYKPVVRVEVGRATHKEVVDLLKNAGYVLFDLEQSNMLFVHPEKHSVTDACSSEKILDAMFIYIDKRNKYYREYNKLKESIKHMQEIHREIISILRESERPRDDKDCLTKLLPEDLEQIILPLDAS